MFTNECKNTVFGHSDCNNKTSHLSKDKKDGAWSIFASCNDEDVVDQSLTLFLAISLIQEKMQGEGVMVKMPQLCSEEEKVWGANHDFQ